MSLIIDCADCKDIFCKIRRRGVSSYFPHRFVLLALFSEWHAPQAPVQNVNPRKHMILSFTTIFLRAHCFTRTLILRKKAIHFSTFRQESSPKPQNPNQLRFLPPFRRQSLQRIQHPISLTINSFSWSSFKKKSLSWKWKFSVWATGNAPKNTRLKVSPTKATSQPRKRSKDWPHDFVPSIQGECDKLNLSEFVSGFLIMIKTYDAKLKEAFLAHLTLLMIKAISYSWSSVRTFHKFVAKQVEQRRLEWHDAKAIDDQAATFFRHSDLRSSSPYENSHNNSWPSSSITPLNNQQAVKPGTGSNVKVCKSWNYTATCDCDKQDSAAYSEHHRCRVCKADHPMLHCPKRRTPIPAQWLLASQDRNPLTSLTRNRHKHESVNNAAVVQYLIASCYHQPNAFGAKVLVPTSLLLANWKTFLSNYHDNIVVDFLTYGWPINYTAFTSPVSFFSFLRFGFSTHHLQAILRFSF